MKKISFFEKWNKEAECKEFSVTRLQMAAMTVFTMLFSLWYFVWSDHEVTLESVALILIFLIGCYTPKALKDLIDAKINKKS